MVIIKSIIVAFLTLFVVAWFINLAGGVSHKAEAATLPVAIVQEPAQPSHYYQYRENGEYGYRSDSRGIVNFVHMQSATPRGNGIVDYVIAHYTQSMLFTVSCSTPCEYVHVVQTTYYGEPITNVSLVPERGTVLWGMVQDAMNGKMQ